MNEPILILTGDGSHSLFMEKMNEPYHSTYGAISESEFVYLNNGYRFLKGLKEINVLEIGFGTGLNCLLTALESDRNGILTHYFALEKYPLSGEMINRLNYPQLSGESGAEIFSKIHEASWEVMVPVTPLFKLKKVKSDVLQCSWSDFPEFDLVYFDAFGPDKQPEMWDSGLFGNIFRKMNKGAVFVTYCAKGSVRRDLIRAGFVTERLPGPKGKREMLRGLKT